MAPYTPKTQGKSMEDIASLLAENAAKMQGAPNVPDTGDNVSQPLPSGANSGSEGSGDGAVSDRGHTGHRTEDTPAEPEADSGDSLVLSDEADTQTTDDSGRSADPSETDTDPDPEIDPTDGDSDSDSSQDDAPAFELSDDTLLDIGDGVEMTVADLIALHDADNSIAERLSEAETTRVEAHALRASVQQEQDQGMQALAYVFQQMVGADEANPLPLPDPQLKQTNPGLYIQQLDAYNAAQADTTERRTAIETAFKEYHKQKGERDESRRKQELVNLHRLVPAVANPQTREAAIADIMDSARHYGFTDAELKGVVDAREMQMAYDAAQYRKLIKNSGKNIEELITTQNVKPAARTRVLRSQNTTAQSQASATAKAIKVTRAQAEKTGKPADVAAFMAAQRSARGA